MTERMESRIRGVAFVPLFLLVAGVTVAVAQVPQPEAEKAQACVVTVAPEMIPVQAEHVELRAALSQVIGEEISARVEEGSGIEVVAIEPVKTDDEAKEARLVGVRLNTSEAAAGEWTLTLRGENGLCSGKVRVRGT